MKLKIIISCFFIFLSLNIFANDDLKMSDINRALDQMKASGMFTPEQIEAARAQMNSLSKDELNELKKKAMSSTNDPKIRKEAEKLVEKIKSESN